MKKAAASKKARRTAEIEATNAVIDENLHDGRTERWYAEKDTIWEKVDVKATFFHTCRRRRDTDNAMASLKAYYDGFVDAGIVPDDSPEHMKRHEPEFKIDKENPRVEFMLTRMQ